MPPSSVATSTRHRSPITGTATTASRSIVAARPRVGRQRPVHLEQEVLPLVRLFQFGQEPRSLRFEVEAFDDVTESRRCPWSLP